MRSTASADTALMCTFSPPPPLALAQRSGSGAFGARVAAPGISALPLEMLPASDPAAEALLIQLPPAWRYEVVVTLAAARTPALTGTGPQICRMGAFVCPDTGARFGCGADALAHVRACGGARGSGGAATCKAAHGKGSAESARASAAAACIAPEPASGAGGGLEVAAAEQEAGADSKGHTGSAFKLVRAAAEAPPLASMRTAAVMEMREGAVAAVAASTSDEADGDEAAVGALLALACASELAAEAEQGSGLELGSAKPVPAPELPPPQPELRLVGSLTDIVALPLGSAAAAAQAVKPDPVSSLEAYKNGLNEQTEAAPRGAIGEVAASTSPLSAGPPLFSGFPGSAAAAAGAAAQPSLVGASHAAFGGGSPANPNAGCFLQPVLLGLPGGLFKTRSEPAKQLLSYADDVRALNLAPEAPLSMAPMSRTGPPVRSDLLAHPPQLGAHAATANVGVAASPVFAAPRAAPDSGAPESGGAVQAAGAAPGHACGAQGSAPADEREGHGDGVAGPVRSAGPSGAWMPRRPLGRAISDPSVLREGLVGVPPLGSGGAGGALQRLPASTSLVSWQARPFAGSASSS